MRDFGQLRLCFLISEMRLITSAKRWSQNRVVRGSPWQRVEEVFLTWVTTYNYLTLSLNLPFSSLAIFDVDPVCSIAMTPTLVARKFLHIFYFPWSYPHPFRPHSHSQMENREVCGPALCLTAGTQPFSLFPHPPAHVSVEPSCPLCTGLGSSPIVFL